MSREHPPRSTRRRRGLPAALIAILSVLAIQVVPGCVAMRARTQVMVSIDGGAMVRAMAQSLRVRVYGGARGDDSALIGQPIQEWSFAVSSDGEGWPRRVALAPLNGDSTRVYRVVASAMSRANGEGAVIAEARAISGYVSRRTLRLEMFIADTCRGVDCSNPQQGCFDGGCRDAVIPASALEPYVSTSDGGSPNTDAGGSGECGRCDDGNACNGLERCVGSECVQGPVPTCDDGFDCTVDYCDAASGCGHQPVDGLCDAGPGGRCDIAQGCQYDVCDASTCTAENGCQDARCEGTTCLRESRCTGDQECCGTECVAPGCDDSDPCTDDSCGAGGCEHAANSASCDDGVFCNGVDVCAGGSCSSPGSPCPGMSRCDEGADTCTGCSGATDCPAPATVLGTCSASTTCSRTGVQSRTTTTYDCVGGTCVPNTSADSVTCTRTTENMPCTSSDRCKSNYRCVNGVCSGDAIVCNDGISCTIDRCSPATGCYAQDGGTCQRDGGYPDASECGVVPCSDSAVSLEAGAPAS